MYRSYIAAQQGSPATGNYFPIRTIGFHVRGITTTASEIIASIPQTPGSSSPFSI